MRILGVFFIASALFNGFAAIILFSWTAMAFAVSTLACVTAIAVGIILLWPAK